MNPTSAGTLNGNPGISRNVVLPTSAMGGVRGRYVERYREGTNLVLLGPDIAAAFPDAKAVNDALRLVLQEKQSPQPR